MAMKESAKEADSSPFVKILYCTYYMRMKRNQALPDIFQ